MRRVSDGAIATDAAGLKLGWGGAPRQVFDPPCGNRQAVNIMIVLLLAGLHGPIGPSSVFQAARVQSTRSGAVRLWLLSATSCSDPGAAAVRLTDASVAIPPAQHPEALDILWRIRRCAPGWAVGRC